MSEGKKKGWAVTLLLQHAVVRPMDIGEGLRWLLLLEPKGSHTEGGRNGSSIFHLCVASSTGTWIPLLDSKVSYIKIPHWAMSQDHQVNAHWNQHLERHWSEDNVSLILLPTSGSRSGHRTTCTGEQAVKDTMGLCHGAQRQIHSCQRKPTAEHTIPWPQARVNKQRH